MTAAYAPFIPYEKRAETVKPTWCLVPSLDERVSQSTYTRHYDTYHPHATELKPVMIPAATTQATAWPGLMPYARSVEPIVTPDKQMPLMTQ